MTSKKRPALVLHAAATRVSPISPASATGSIRWIRARRACCRWSPPRGGRRRGRRLRDDRTRRRGRDQRGKAQRIPMNVDGVTAVIYCELGLTPELGRGVFILARSVGILAHAIEQMTQGAASRPLPKSIGYTYTGPARRPFRTTRRREGDSQ